MVYVTANQNHLGVRHSSGLLHLHSNFADGLQRGPFIRKRLTQNLLPMTKIFKDINKKRVWKRRKQYVTSLLVLVVFTLSKWRSSLSSPLRVFPEDRFTSLILSNNYTNRYISKISTSDIYEEVCNYQVN